GGRGPRPAEPDDAHDERRARGAARGRALGGAAEEPRRVRPDHRARRPAHGSPGAARRHAGRRRAQPRARRRGRARLGLARAGARAHPARGARRGPLHAPLRRRARARPGHVAQGARGAMKTLALLLVALSLGCALTSKGEPLTPRYFSPTLGPAAAEARRDAAPLELRIGRIEPAAHLEERIAYRVDESEL